MQPIPIKSVVDSSPSRSQKTSSVEVTSASTKPLVYSNPMNHHQLAKFTELTARSLQLDLAEKPKLTKISKYIKEIEADIKGIKKDSLEFPEIANILITLGKYIRRKELEKIPSCEIDALNKLVLELLNNPDFNLSEEQEKKHLWAVHVDTVWLAHEMKKKNIFGNDFLHPKTQTSILEKGEDLIQKKTPMHNLLSHNFQAINILWNTKIQTSNEVTKQALENLQIEPRNLNTQKEIDADKINSSIEASNQLQQEIKSLKEAQLKEKEKKEKEINELVTKTKQLEEINKAISNKLEEQTLLIAAQKKEHSNAPGRPSRPQQKPTLSPPYKLQPVSTPHSDTNKTESNPSSQQDSLSRSSALREQQNLPSPTKPKTSNPPLSKNQNRSQKGNTQNIPPAVNSQG